MNKKFKKIFVTGNSSKFKEIKKYLLGLKQFKMDDLPEIQSLDISEIIKHKLISAKGRLCNDNNLIIVEDTGLYLKALNDFPGPLIKFLLHSIGNEGIYNLCVRFNEFSAIAKTVFGVLNTQDNQVNYFTGKVKGTITHPRGDFGFGWDKIFIPEGSDKTFAEMETIEEKNIYSMRHKALLKLIQVIKLL